MMNPRQRELLLETIQEAMNQDDLVFTINDDSVKLSGWGFNYVTNLNRFKEGKPAIFDLNVEDASKQQCWRRVATTDRDWETYGKDCERWEKTDYSLDPPQVIETKYVHDLSDPA